MAPIAGDQTWQADHEGKNESYNSGVSWAAVIGGAFVAAALSLILFALCAGIGFSAISPWANAGASASTIGAGAIACFILVQLLSSSRGGIWRAGCVQSGSMFIRTKCISEIPPTDFSFGLSVS